MTKKTRKILFLFFVALFFILTPIASLYTAGYKLNLSWPLSLNTALQKTGMLIIETDPRGAQVLIDGKNPGSALKRIFTKTKTYTTPIKIKGLIPEEYDLEIRLDGHWEWNKKVSVYPGQATQLKEIKLFKKDLPIKILDTSENDITISPNEELVALVRGDSVLVFNLKNETQKNISLDHDYPGKDFISWSPDSKKIIANNILVKLENDEQIKLSQILGSKITNLKWSQTDNNKLFYEYLGAVRQFDISSKISVEIAKTEICLDYIQDRDSMIIVSKKAETSQIKSLSLKDGKTNQELDLPYSPEYKLLKKENGLVHLYDEKFKILYLINIESYLNPLEDVINNIAQYKWSSQNSMLYSNDFEIWLYNSYSKEKSLITRISEKITASDWHPGEKHIIYATDSGIYILELEKRERRSITELLNLEKIKFLKINNNGDVIYFWAKIENEEALYKLKI